MTSMRVKAGEKGMVRLFSIDLAHACIDSFAQQDDTGEGPARWPLRDALGARNLDEDHIEVFDLDHLDGVGLSRYFDEGLGVAATDLDGDRAMLDRLKGHVLIVHSAAFAGFAQTLRPKSPLRWIATYREEKPPVQFKPLPDQSAQGQIAPDNSEQPAHPQMMLLWALLAPPVAALVIGAIVWWVAR